LPDPNYGQYSPTTVHLATELDQYRHIFERPGFDWRTQVVLERDPGKLSRATAGTLYVERGYVRIEANGGEGRSLLLLPVQYSNCLKISGTGDPHLVRANMFFAGLLFSGKSMARIDFDFGFLNSGCRRVDIADLRRLKIPEAAEKGTDELNPYAIRRLSDVRRRLREVREVYRTVQ
jgi:hypothetical protein